MLLLIHAMQAFGFPAVADLIEVDAPTEVTVGTVPTLTVRVPDAEAVLWADCSLSGADHRQTHITPLLVPGEVLRVVLPAVPPVSAAECVLVARLASGRSERREETISWTWVEPVPDQ